MERSLAEYLSDKTNATDSVMQAVMDTQAGDTLYLGGGELHFYPDGCSQKEYWISNNDAGIKTIAFLSLGKRILPLMDRAPD